MKQPKTKKTLAEAMEEKLTTLAEARREKIEREVREKDRMLEDEVMAQIFGPDKGHAA